MESSEHERFVKQVIDAQGRLYALILSLTADPNLSDDILQDTNLALLRKEEQCTPGSDFNAWSSSIAYFEVLTARKRCQRERLRFDDEIVQILAADTRQGIADCEPSSVRLALRHCLALLSESKRNLLSQRYGGANLQQLASQHERTAGTISQTLYRARVQLKDCILRRLAREEQQ